MVYLTSVCIGSRVCLHNKSWQESRLYHGQQAWLIELHIKVFVVKMITVNAKTSSSISLRRSALFNPIQTFIKSPPWIINPFITLSVKSHPNSTPVEFCIFISDRHFIDAEFARAKLSRAWNKQACQLPKVLNRLYDQTLCFEYIPSGTAFWTIQIEFVPMAFLRSKYRKTPLDFHDADKRQPADPSFIQPTKFLKQTRTTLFQHA